MCNEFQFRTWCAGYAHGAFRFRHLCFIDYIVIAITRTAQLNDAPRNFVKEFFVPDFFEQQFKIITRD